MGVEIQTEAYTVVGINLRGDIFFSHTEPLDLRTTNLVSAFVQIVQRFQPSLEATGMPLLGIGVGLPGFVDPLRGVLQASMPFEHYEEIQFVLESRAMLGLSVPILVDNDANCGCWGELAFRNSSRPQNFVFVLGELRKHTIVMDDWRIMALGLGLVINGKVHHGQNNSAGEFRSILYNRNAINQFSISDEEARYFLQDPKVDSKIIEELSRHIAFLINVLNLGKVVLGGPLETLVEPIRASVEEFVADNWAYPKKVDYSLESSRLGDQAVAYGAAGMYLEHLIEVPRVSPDGTKEGIRGVDLLPRRYTRFTAE